MDCATQSSGESGATSASVALRTRRDRSMTSAAPDCALVIAVPVSNYTVGRDQVAPIGAKCYASSSPMDESGSRTDQKRANRVKEEALARLSDDLVAVS